MAKIQPDITDRCPVPSEQGQSGPLALRGGWLIFTALAMQLLSVTFVDDIHFGVAKAMLLVSYVILIPAVLLNIRRRGIVIVFAGLLMNFAAIAANGGTMPLDPVAVGLDPQAIPEVNDGVGFLPFSKDTLAQADEAVNIRFLTDIFSAPGPLRAAYSLGDLFIFAGLLVYLTRFVRLRSHKEHIETSA